MGISKYSLRRSALVTATALAAITAGWGSAARAQASPVRAYHLAPGKLADALRAVARISGTDVIFTADAVKGLRAPPLDGTFTSEEAITRLIAGTELQIEMRDGTVLLRGRSKPPVDASDRSTDATDVLVTGTRIKGGRPSSPVIVLTAETMRNEGRNDLGEAIRSLPQNFSGGQNPGVTFVGGGTNQNVTSGSSLNLRGLGPDASLTLLNGHRIAYDSVTQAIDISSIPLAAVERLEIVADGASALYGSDAVGGVANIMLKKDFDGIDSRARFGASTDGGFVQQQYSAVGGSTWSSGGALVAADYQHSTQIAAGDRSYTSAVPRDTTLYPTMDYIGVVATGHQKLGIVTFDIDSSYSRRKSPVYAAYVADGYTANGALLYSATEAYEVTPRLSVDLASGWHGEIRGTSALESIYLRTDYYVGGTLFQTAPTRYDNTLSVIEASAEGGLIRLPGGLVRLAFGGGYRSVGLAGEQKISTAGAPLSTTLTFDQSRDAAFGYGELYIPVISSSQGVPAIHHLSVTAAGRVESYAGFNSVFTPKFGAIYSPTSSIDIKGSWGRSFKAPTLQQTSLPAYATLGQASSYVSGQPAAAAVLLTDGGNPSLQPERATTWTATLGFHPQSWNGARVEVSYFNVRYKDRVLAPLGARAGALSNPIYQDIVTLNPSDTHIDAVIARAPGGLLNATSFPFSYSNIIAIVDNRYKNIARFEAQGVDFSASVPIDFGKAGRLIGTASISYLESRQQSNPGGAILTRAGTIFNPPNWRARVGATWSLGELTVAPAVDYIGDVTDARTATPVPVGSMTTFDLTTRYRIEHGGAFEGLEVSLSVLNAFNAKPARIVVPAFFYPAYDSSNYSAIGRTISITIGKAW